MRKSRKRSSAPAIILALLVVALCAVVADRVGLNGKEANCIAGAPNTPTAETSAPTEGDRQAPQVDIAELDTEAEQADGEQLLERYAAVAMTENELQELAEVIYHEAGNQPADGQQAVAEVVLNRVVSADFPDTVHEVIFDGFGTSVPQFSTAELLGTVNPDKEQYDAIRAALYGPSILPSDVVYFSRGGENDRVWGEIGDHVFCYGYVWK